MNTKVTNLLRSFEIFLKKVLTYAVRLAIIMSSDDISILDISVLDVSDSDIAIVNKEVWE